MFVLNKVQLYYVCEHPGHCARIVELTQYSPTPLNN